MFVSTYRTGFLGLKQDFELRGPTEALLKVQEEAAREIRIASPTSNSAPVRLVAQNGITQTMIVSGPKRHEFAAQMSEAAGKHGIPVAISVTGRFDRQQRLQFNGSDAAFLEMQAHSAKVLAGTK